MKRIYEKSCVLIGKEFQLFKLMMKRLSDNFWGNICFIIKFCLYIIACWSKLRNY